MSRAIPSLRRFGMALLLPACLALAGCTETTDGDGAAEVAGATTDQTDEPQTDDSSDEPSSDDGLYPTPVNADDGETWIYPDGFEIAMTGVQAYDGGNGFYLDFEYPMKLSFELVNGGSEEVHLVWAPVGECTEGNLVESQDDTLTPPPDTIAPGATAAFETGFGVDDEEASGPCEFRVKPSPSHEWAAIAFTAPEP